MQAFKNLFYKTHTTTLTVTSTNGFHLRPVAKFVSTAKSFECEITASYQNKKVNAKAVNSLLSLNLDKEYTFSLHTKGKQAKEALHTLKELFETLMHEEKEILPIQADSHSYEGACIEAQSICKGIGIAPLYTYKEESFYEDNSVTFTEAVQHALLELETRYETDKQSDDAMIYLAQKELLFSLYEKSNSLEILQKHIDQEIQILKNGGKLASKIVDYLDILKRVKSHLGYSYKVDFPKQAFILLANDLLPSDIHLLENSPVQGVILKETTPTSHTAILLRGAGIPSLIVSSILPSGEKLVILDAHSAVLVTAPSNHDIKKATQQQNLDHDKKSIAYNKRFDKAVTKNNQQINVYANITNFDSAQIAKEEGAEGVGLFRTEFLFDTIKPSVKVQQDAYESIFNLFEEMTIRTLDVGGDKALPYINLPKENNPFLGIRGVRLFQTHPKLMREQLLAILKASKNRPIKIMFPMISNVQEFMHAKSFAVDIAKKNDIDMSNILFGIMIEIPSVLFLIKEFNKVVDFYSIGTNDLSQYLFATERTHPTLKIDTHSDVVFLALEQIVKEATKPVSICGELASDSKAIPKLIHLGLTTLSVSPKSIPQTKEEIRNI